MPASLDASPRHPEKIDYSTLQRVRKEKKRKNKMANDAKLEELTELYSACFSHLEDSKRDELVTMMRTDYVKEVQKAANDDLTYIDYENDDAPEKLKQARAIVEHIVEFISKRYPGRELNIRISIGEAVEFRNDEVPTHYPELIIYQSISDNYTDNKMIVAVFTMIREALQMGDNVPPLDIMYHSRNEGWYYYECDLRKTSSPFAYSIA